MRELVLFLWLGVGVLAGYVVGVVHEGRQLAKLRAAGAEVVRRAKDLEKELADLSRLLMDVEQREADGLARQHELEELVSDLRRRG